MKLTIKTISEWKAQAIKAIEGDARNYYPNDIKTNAERILRLIAEVELVYGASRTANDAIARSNGLDKEG